MKNYKYVYLVRTNNLCYGCKPLGIFPTIAKAYDNMQVFKNKYGVCEIIKKRQYV